MSVVMKYAPWGRWTSDDTSRRLKSAMQDRAREGKPQDGMRRFGYSKDGMAIVDAEREQHQALAEELTLAISQIDTPT